MIRRVKGFKDILPEENQIRNFIEKTGEKIFEANGFKKLTTPILEKTDLFLRSIGETSDIVQKEMYTFEDKNGEMLSLRPEGTASVVRAFVENSLFSKQGTDKYYYFGPMFRRERPQKGRLRQFYQMGVEMFGKESPLTDAHIIYILSRFLQEIKINNVVIELNSVGCDKCRPGFEKALRNYFSDFKNDLCSDCIVRLEKNPLRILDCKKESCNKLKDNSPDILSFLCDKCNEHHSKVKQYLEFFNVDYIENRFMVRGLDYYTKTVFEAVSTGLGAQNAVGAGGRYNNLVKEITGKDFPGIGFALGVERLVILLEQLKVHIKPDFFMIIIGESSLKKGIELYTMLTNQGLRGEFDYELKGLKNQLKKSDKFGSKLAIILGEEEIAENVVIIKDMNSGNQKKVPFEELSSLRSSYQFERSFA